MGKSSNAGFETVDAIDAYHSQPDVKTRRYDRQLRLWAASGQSALENSRVLVISTSSTSTSFLKNLVLPGIGQFTILDEAIVTPQDAGNNFFLDGPSSIGKPRAAEAVRLLRELNDSVEGVADTRNLNNEVFADTDWLARFNVVLAHNMEKSMLDKLANLLWDDEKLPPLVVIRSAGFLAEFYIQNREHTIIESHSENAPSLRIDKAFPDLQDLALSMDFANMDPTEHSHIPYVLILVRAIELWKRSHDGKPPKTSLEKKEFKEFILSMRVKFDEENFDEAEAQAYRCWIETVVPTEIIQLFNDPVLTSLTPDSPPFFHLLSALQKFTSEPPYVLPLTSTIPDMKASTESYIRLQNMYKNRAEEEKQRFKSHLTVPVDGDTVDTFVKNAHALRVLRGEKWGTLDEDQTALAEAIISSPKQAAIHLSLSALSKFMATYPCVSPTMEDIAVNAQKFLPEDAKLPTVFPDFAGEIVRAPTAELPNTAAFIGGLVAQEVIKMITRQYVPIKGYCCVDLIEAWTGML